MKKIKYLLVGIAVLAGVLCLRHHNQVAAVKNNTPAAVPADSINRAMPEITPVISKFDSIISSEIRRSGTVGAAVAVTYKNRVAFLKCYGVKRAGGTDSVDINTVFRLASVSKTISGTLAGILADQNVINLDDRIIDHVPEFRLRSRENTRNLTVRNVLSHTSGLVAHSYDNYAELKTPMRRIIPMLSQVNILAPPGKKYDYQNVIFSLLDTVLASTMYKPFGTIMQETVFSPFGMADASTGFTKFNENPNKALPHAGSERRYYPIRMNDRYYTTQAAAGVNASIADMARFLLQFTSGDEAPVSAGVKNIIFEPHIVSPLTPGYFSHWDRVDSKEYALGWRIAGYKGRTVAYHGGYVSGYKTEIAYCDEEDIGIVYLSNSPNSVASISVPTLLNLVFEYSDGQRASSAATNN